MGTLYERSVPLIRIFAYPLGFYPAAGLRQRPKYAVFTFAPLSDYRGSGKKPFRITKYSGWGKGRRMRITKYRGLDKGPTDYEVQGLGQRPSLPSDYKVEETRAQAHAKGKR